MNKVEIKKKNQLNIDESSAKNYIGDMVYQLYEIADMAGLDHEARLLYATNLAITSHKGQPKR